MSRIHLAHFLTAGLVGLFAVFNPALGQQRLTSVGVAKIDITPEHPVLLAGYGSRDREHEGVDEPLWARAMAIGDDSPVIVIAVDNCGVPGAIVEAVAATLVESHGLERERIVVASTHTHNAPTLTGYAPVLWGDRADAAQLQRVNRYTEWLTQRLIEVAHTALENRQPATLSWGQGRVGFGGNRRVLEDGRWQGFGFQADGPVDHSLPVLVARSPDNRTLAIWANYACHCTTVGTRNRIGGDWAGYANATIERAFPDCISLITIGCGADVGPQPTGTLELARQHGEAMAAQIQRLVESRLTSLPIEISTSLKRIRLPYDEIPTREHFERLSQLQSFEGYHARLMLDELKTSGELPKEMEYPIGCWRFGDELCIVFLAGEVVVDYAVRLKHELDWQRLWINGWCNDVPCYIPSRRVLAQGGYEADFSQIYYARPTRFSAEVEDLIVDTVTRLAGDRFSPTKATPEPTFLRLPTGLEWFQNRVDGWVASVDGETRAQLATAVEMARQSQSGFDALTTNDAEHSSWFNYSGLKENRPFIRQTESGATLAWRTDEVSVAADQDTVVFVFAGGLGWSSEPSTEGFELTVVGGGQIEFDVTNRPTTWTSLDRSARLVYLPTWRSDVDSGGLFYLEIPTSWVTSKQPCEISVTSLGAGSKRWFSVDPIRDVKSIEGVLVRAFKDRRIESP